jgi:CubicO group peptidase (beta-lactamase class C family)
VNIKLGIQMMKNKTFALLATSMLLIVLAKADIRKSDMNLIDFLFKGNLNTDSILIYKNNTKLLERYGRSYNKKTKHIMWSVSKSFTSAVVGVAIEEKKLRLDQSICDFYQKLSVDKCIITILDLLHYKAGFSWVEQYEPLGILELSEVTKGDVLQMIYGEGHADMANYVLNRPLAYKPGTTLQYNTGTPNVLMDILKRVYKNKYDDLVNGFLDILGVDSYLWSKDLSGTFIGGSHLFATPSLMLEFGKLFLNKGIVNNKKILSKKWIEFSTQQVKAKKIIDHQDIPGIDIVESIGAMWWLNTELDGKTPWPDAPEDTFISWGHWGQFIIIIPSLNMIIVRTGEDKTESFNINQFIKLSIKYVEGL